MGAVVLEGGRCLAFQRGPRRSLAGKWEFPGGKVEAGEDPRAALERELREELGVEACVGAKLAEAQSHVEGREIHLEVFVTRLEVVKLELREHVATRWLGADDLEAVDWADADRALLGPLRSLLAGS